MSILHILVHILVGVACTMCIMIKDSSGTSCSSTDLATSVSLTSGVVCQDATSMNMTCTILGTTALVWSSDINQQSFLVRDPPGSSKVLSVTKTLSCTLMVSWAYANNIQSVMTCWSPGGWAGMNGTNINCLSHNTASCSVVLSVSSCSSSASSPANTSSSPATTPSVTNNSTSISNHLGAIIVTAAAAICIITVVTIIICVYTSTTIKGKRQTLHDTSTSSGVALQSVSMETQTFDGILVMPKATVARSQPQKASHSADEGSNEGERTGEESNIIKFMQENCDPQARSHGSGNPPCGGPSIQEVSGSEAPSLAVHAPKLYVHNYVVVSVQPGHETAIELQM